MKASRASPAFNPHLYADRDKNQLSTDGLHYPFYISAWQMLFDRLMEKFGLFC